MSTKFSIKYGMTVNVGDYSNTRPEIGLEGEVPAGEDASRYIHQQLTKIITIVQGIADDDLEAHGQNALYYDGQSYSVKTNKKRRVILMHPYGKEPPTESNWKERDNWSAGRYYGRRNYPERMREHTALALVDDLHTEYPQYQIIYDHDGAFTHLPPLPDPGPEPVWHQKDLKRYLDALNIPKDRWEEIATLDRIDNDYLGRVHKLTRSDWTTTAQLDKDDALNFILENRPFPTEPEAIDEDDEDWDDAAANPTPPPINLIAYED